MLMSENTNIRDIAIENTAPTKQENRMAFIK